MSTKQNGPPSSTRAREVIRLSIADVTESGLVGSDRAAVLAALVIARLGSSSLDKATEVAERTPGDAPGTRDEDPGDGVLDRIAGRFQLPRSVVELVFDDPEGNPTLVLSGRRLAKDKANATKQIAQLIAGARQAAGVEEWTSLSVIRRSVTDYGKLDGPNFAKHIAQLDDVFVFRGRGASREVGATRPGFEAIADLVRSFEAN